MTFKTGISGNIKGRPVGIIDKRTKYRQHLENHAEELIEKVVELALEGDITALKICLDRLIPRIRDENDFDKNESLERTLENMKEARRAYEEY